MLLGSSLPAYGDPVQLFRCEGFRFLGFLLSFWREKECLVFGFFLFGLSGLFSFSIGLVPLRFSFGSGSCKFLSFSLFSCSSFTFRNIGFGLNSFERSTSLLHSCLFILFFLFVCGC